MNFSVFFCSITASLDAITEKAWRMNYYWDWNFFRDASTVVNGDYLDTLFSALCFTLMTAGIAAIIALIIGTIIGTLRAMPNNTFAKISNVYIELFRTIPLLVQIFLWYFVLPGLFPTDAADWIKNLPNAQLIIGALCLSFYTSARIAVHVSVGIRSVSRNRMPVSKADGLNSTQADRCALLAMTCRLITPNLSTEATTLLKNSSIALTISLFKLTVQTSTISDVSIETLGAFAAAMLIYILVSKLATSIAVIINKSLGDAVITALRK